MRSIPLKSSYRCVTTYIPFPSKSKWKLFRAQCSNSEEYSHNGLFSRSLKRWKIFRLRAPRLGVFGEFIFKSEIARANERYLDRFSTSGDNDGSVESRAWSERKKKSYHFIQYHEYRKKLCEPFASRDAIRPRRDARTTRHAIGKRLLRYIRTSPYHFNGILNSRRRIPKLMQSQFPGSCA